MLTLLLGLCVSWAYASDDAADSAVFLLRESTQLQRDGRHHMLLRSLRQLRDPQLAPFFSELAQSENPNFNIHGILGLAESATPPQIDLVRVAAIKDPATQAELISAAMDGDLLTPAQSQQLIQWPGLDLAVKTLLAAQLIKAGQFQQPEVLKEAVASENPARRAMAGALLMQTGDASGRELLDQLDASQDPRRDAIRGMLLDTIWRFELAKTAPWVLTLIDQPQLSTRLRLQAMRVVLRDQPSAGAELWKQQFLHSEEPAYRMRLALVLLQSTSQMPEELAKLLIDSQDPLLKIIGQAVQAVHHQQDEVAALKALLAQHHTLATEWVLGYCQAQAELSVAQALLLHMLETFDPQSRDLAQHMDHTVTAAQILYERDPEAALVSLRPWLEDQAGLPPRQQAILLGLIRGQAPRPDRAIAGITQWNRPSTAALALVLKAKHATQLSTEEMQQLSLVVRGANLPQLTLRVQAAWAYLRLSGQADLALAKVSLP